MVNCIKPAKKADVMKLLDAIGVSDSAKTFYIEACKDVNERDVINDNDELSSNDEAEP